VWWLDIDHVQSVGKYLLVTAILVWSTTLIPAYAILIISRARTPSGDAVAAALQGRRVAIVVTKAPSEPFPVLERTLRGALLQDGIPHDVWLADEDPTPQTTEWCRRHGVKISSRKGVTEYHREGWPRRTKSKEGNLAYFYDHYGYDQYDFVAQFDVDHVPSRHYLREALAPFADPRVGYVSAPSICDSNAATRWSARGRLHDEASMHGLLQAGYNSGWAPLCIGSHYTVRTAALRAVGGLGPELAEDHSTTLLLNAAGWKGVHAVDAIAHGNGPDSFVDLVVQ
jgi:cellulose synthase (UDP-forming)